MYRAKKIKSRLDSKHLHSMGERKEEPVKNTEKVVVSQKPGEQRVSQKPREKLMVLK